MNAAFALDAATGQQLWTHERSALPVRSPDDSGIAAVR
jgi:outer membrane protein assembly factor BamB